MKINFTKCSRPSYFEPSPEESERVIQAIKHLSDLLPFHVNEWNVDFRKIPLFRRGYSDVGFVTFNFPEIIPQNVDLTDDDWLEFWFLLDEIPDTITFIDRHDANFYKNMVALDKLMTMSDYRQLPDVNVSMIENILTSPLNWFKLKDDMVDPDFNLDEGLLRALVRELI